MTDNIAVVKPYYLKEEAYRMGHSEFEDTDLGPDADPDLSGFTDSARYANHVLPDLRAMSGFEDNKGGTYTVNRRVAAIKPGCEEDEPAEAELTEAQYVFEELVSAWRMGAYDGMEDTYDPEAALV